MIDRTTKLRWRRRFRQSKRQVEDIGLQAEEQLERHFFRRIGRLADVRRFVISWTLLILIIGVGLIVQTQSLNSYYRKLKPVSGGSFSEGILGSFTNANPLYATSLVDSSVSKLVFSGLLKTDSANKLVGDLADSWQVDDRAVNYTLRLRNNLYWHDGQALTADDVVFTYKTIQNPDAKSFLFNSWKGIKVEAKDSKTIVFTLPNSLSSFPYSLTNGIVPKHILEPVPVSQLRSIRFNTVNPIGSGPFMWDKVEVNGDTPETREEIVGMSAYKNYFLGRPKIDHFEIHSFHDEKHMTSSFKNDSINAMVGLDNTPDALVKTKNLQEFNIPLSAEIVVFLKTTSENLKDIKVRQALVKATDQKAIINQLGYPAVVATEPILNGQIGYDKSRSQLSNNVDQANKLLDDAGWKKDSTGIRIKDKKILTINLFAQNSSEYTAVTQLLQKQWRIVGVDLQVQLLQTADIQGVVSRHEYDALLYGISIGPDPDVFAYWHSSQADPHSVNRLNLSEYKSVVSDKALEAGRSRTDPMLRSIKYRPFLEAWRVDAPAVVLYQPRFLYISKGPIFGFDPTVINTSSDRFANVNDWMVKQEQISE